MESTTKSFKLNHSLITRPMVSLIIFICTFPNLSKCLFNNTIIIGNNSATPLVRMATTYKNIATFLTHSTSSSTTYGAIMYDIATNSFSTINISSSFTFTFNVTMLTPHPLYTSPSQNKYIVAGTGQMLEYSQNFTSSISTTFAAGQAAQYIVYTDQ